MDQIAVFETGEKPGQGETVVLNQGAVGEGISWGKVNTGKGALKRGDCS